MTQTNLQTSGSDVYLCREDAASTERGRSWLLQGQLDSAVVGQLLATIFKRPPQSGGSLVLDLSGVTRIDSAGAAALMEIWRHGQDKGYRVVLKQVPDVVHAFLEHYHVPSAAQDLAAQPPLLEALGDTTLRAGRSGLALLVLAADVTLESLLSLVRPWKLRWGAILEQSILIGSRALGIVALIMFLVGLTLAFQSAYQLRQFGAAIYVATLTAISVVSEMGPLITAILVAGRSGSSIASEVATMKVNEEVDAMQVMGISFVSYVAVPKMIALLTMVPLLTLMADVVGILGGWAVAITYLDLGTAPYFNETADSLVFGDISTGLLKSMVFAWGIGLLGLYHGIRVQGGAQEVGRATTDAVVASIFFIIIADAFFSILFYVVLP